MPAAKDELQLPDTKTYRVCILAASYMRPAAGYDRDQKPAVVHAWAYGRLGEEIDLTEGEATRLTNLGAVLPAGAPLTYQEMSDKQLSDVCAEREITVAGTGAKGGVLRVDMLNALAIHDQAVLRAAAPAPAVAGNPDAS